MQVDLKMSENNEHYPNAAVLPQFAKNTGLQSNLLHFINIAVCKTKRVS